ncbi:hypothetical protein R3P38DRAFT_3439750 [Favolaschia claudopus]|uniref:Uncharacterized protein n=1 Tax=Favolaschia claudopus TaxID=2862362 RepID=A0AAV9ZR11_9AGAR
MPRHRILATEEPRKGRRRHPTKRARQGRRNSPTVDQVLIMFQLSTIPPAMASRWTRSGSYHSGHDGCSRWGPDGDVICACSEFQAVIWSREGAEGYHRVDGQREAGQGRSPKPARATTSPRPLPPSSSTPHPTETQLPVRTAIKVDQHSFALQPNALLDALEKDIPRFRIALELGIILRLSLIVFITEVTKTSMPMRRRGVTVIPKCSQPPRRDGDEGASELLHPRTEW